MLKFFHQNLITGHGTTGEPARNKDIAGTIFQHDERKVLAQLDHLAQQCLVCTAGADREEHTLTLADHRLMHQLVHCFHHFAIRAAVTAEFRLQILDRARLVLNRALDFITNCHNIFSPCSSAAAASDALRPCRFRALMLHPACGAFSCPHRKLSVITQKNSPVLPIRGCTDLVNLPDDLQTGRPELQPQRR